MSTPTNSQQLPSSVTGKHPSFSLSKDLAPRLAVEIGDYGADDVVNQTANIGFFNVWMKKGWGGRKNERKNVEKGKERRSDYGL